MGERRKLLLTFVLGVIIATAGTATAAKLITGKQIKDGTITMKDLSKSVRAKINKAGKRGPAGRAGPTGPTGTVDTSNFFTKAQSDARYAQVRILDTGAEHPVSVPTNTQSTVVSLLCPNGYLPGKGNFEIDGFDESLAFGLILDLERRYEVIVNNTSGAPANGTVRAKVNCFQLDPAIVPEPQFP